MSWRERKKERREENAIYTGHLRLCLQPKGSAHTPLGPICTSRCDSVCPCVGHIVSFLPYPLPESMGTDTSGSQSRISWLSCFLSCSNYYFFQLCSFQILIKFILSHSHARVVKEGKLLVREQVEKTVVRKQT